MLRAEQDPAVVTASSLRVLPPADIAMYTAFYRFRPAAVMLVLREHKVRTNGCRGIRARLTRAFLPFLLGMRVKQDHHNHFILPLFMSISTLIGTRIES